VSRRAPRGNRRARRVKRQERRRHRREARDPSVRASARLVDVGYPRCLVLVLDGTRLDSPRLAASTALDSSRSQFSNFKHATSVLDKLHAHRKFRFTRGNSARKSTLARSTRASSVLHYLKVFTRPSSLFVRKYSYFNRV